jgi:NAD(P) transhydrogenase
VFTTILAMNFPAPVLAQALSLLTVGGAAGLLLGAKVTSTDLPQTVAAFHALVGIAAVATSIASYISCGHPDTLHAIASFLGVFIGGITFTGSLAAFRKLANLMKDKQLQFPNPHLLNKPIMATNVLGLALMLAYPQLGALVLLYSSITSSVMGWNITNNIGNELTAGSADMPVAITVLNSYSGWALCAEGFMLANPLLTIVGSLIGSSGAILSYIMCKAMNRSLENVIFGSYAQLGSGEKMEITGRLLLPC